MSHHYFPRLSVAALHKSIKGGANHVVFRPDALRADRSSAHGEEISRGRFAKDPHFMEGDFSPSLQPVCVGLTDHFTAPIQVVAPADRENLKNFVLLPLKWD